MQDRFNWTQFQCCIMRIPSTMLDFLSGLTMTALLPLRVVSPFKQQP